MNDSIELTQVTEQSHALRNVGQALEEIHLYCFEIASEGGELLIRADVAALKKSARRDRREMALGTLWRRLRSRYLAKSESSSRTTPPMEIRYSWKELSRSERNRQARSSKDPEKPDVYHLPEMLRLVGSYLDSKRARFLALSKDEQRLTLRYRTERGEIKSEVHEVASFYDLSVHLYLKRSKHSS